MFNYKIETNSMDAVSNFRNINKTVSTIDTKIEKKIKRNFKDITMMRSLLEESTTLFYGILKLMMS